MIIDVHTHNFPDTIAPRAIAGMTKAIAPLLKPVGDGTLANQLDHLDLGGIDKAVMCPIATKPAQFEVIFRTALAIREGAMGERAARKIIPFASVHPQDECWSEHLEEIACAGIRGIKVHPYYQNFSLSDPAVWPLFRKAADLGLVVQCHAGIDIGYPGRTDSCLPRDVAALMRAVPDLKFIAAHLGGCAGLDAREVDALVETGVYIDTSALARTWHRDPEVHVLRSWPKDRILFGTDFPWNNYPEVVAWVKSIRDPKDWDALFSGNARRLLGV